METNLLEKTASPQYTFVQLEVHAQLPFSQRAAICPVLHGKTTFVGAYLSWSIMASAKLMI
jgi:hypothetical protein